MIRTSDGVVLFVEELGPADRDAILFAHEFGGDTGTWDSAFSVLSAHFRCVRYAARGFNPSQVPKAVARYGQDRSTKDLLDVVSALKIHRVHLVGCSMGSFTCLMAATQAQIVIVSLTLIGCSTGPRSAEETLIYREALSQEIELLDDKADGGAVEWFANDPVYARMAEKQPKIWHTYLDRLKMQSVDGARYTLQTVHWNRSSLVDLRDRIERITAPVLVLIGEEDHPLVLETAPFLNDCLAHCQVLNVPGTGHLVHLEEPELFHDAFLKLVLANSTGQIRKE